MSALSLRERNANKRKLTDSPTHGSLMIIGRRWFDSKNGNTYHTAEIIVNGAAVHKTPFAYGYGDAYVQSAAEWLDEQGYVALERHANGALEPLWRYCRERGIALTCVAVDVRKRDL